MYIHINKNIYVCICERVNRQAFACVCRIDSPVFTRCAWIVRPRNNRLTILPTSHCPSPLVIVIVILPVDTHNINTTNVHFVFIFKATLFGIYNPISYLLLITSIELSTKLFSILSTLVFFNSTEINVYIHIFTIIVTVLTRENL